MQSCSVRLIGVCWDSLLQYILCQFELTTFNVTVEQPYSFSIGFPLSIWKPNYGTLLW